VKGLSESLRCHAAGLRASFDKRNHEIAVALLHAGDFYVMTAGRFFTEENRDNYFFAEIYGREWRETGFDRAMSFPESAPLALTASNDLHGLTHTAPMAL